jgi:hypothetical protein
MNKNLLVILAFMAFVYAGCKDIAYTPTPPAPERSYFPETLGSTWRYRDSTYGDKTDTAAIYGTKIDTLTYTINGATTDFNSKICYNVNVLSKLNGPSTSYFYYYKHLCALLETEVPYGFTELQFLIDTASVGYTWHNSPTLSTYLNGSPVQIITTILERNISRVVGGKTFTKVIHTSLNYQINIKGAGYKNIAYYDFYLANGVGLIEKDTYIYGNINKTERIIDYSIK